MKSSQSRSEPAAAAKPAPYCAFPGCKVPPTKTCSRCKETQYCSKEHQTEHWRWHKKICVPPDKTPPTFVPPAPLGPLKGSVNEEEDEEDTCIICFDHVVNANLRPCGHSVTCKGCTEKLRGRNKPCPLCRKKIAGFTLGKWQSTIGEHGLWPTSLKNLTQLASGEGFNEYFQKQFNGNEEAYLRWKEVFDVLEIGNARDVGPDLPLEQQVLRITKSEDLGKLRALAKLCSREFFDDPSLTLNQLSCELDENNEFEEAKELYERCLAGMMKLFGEDHRETLGTLNNLGLVYKRLGNYEKALEYYERALEGSERLLGKDHPQTLMAVMNIVNVYDEGLENYEKAEELYESVLEGYEAQFGKDHTKTRRGI